MDSVKDMEFFNMPMEEISMQVNGKMILNMEKVLYIKQMEISYKQLGKMIKLMDQEF